MFDIAPSEFVLFALVALIGLSFKLLATWIGLLLTAVGIAYFVFGLPLLVWRNLLGKRVFGWGTLELRRVNRQGSQEPGTR